MAHKDSDNVTHTLLVPEQLVPHLDALAARISHHRDDVSHQKKSFAEAEVELMGEMDALRLAGLEELRLRRETRPRASQKRAKVGHEASAYQLADLQRAIYGAVSAEVRTSRLENTNVLSEQKQNAKKMSVVQEAPVAPPPKRPRTSKPRKVQEEVANTRETNRVLSAARGASPLEEAHPTNTSTKKKK